MVVCRNRSNRNCQPGHARSQSTNNTVRSSSASHVTAISRLRIPTRTHMGRSSARLTLRVATSDLHTCSICSFPSYILSLQFEPHCHVRTPHHPRPHHVIHPFSNANPFVHRQHRQDHMLSPISPHQRLPAGSHLLCHSEASRPIPTFRCRSEPCGIRQFITPLPTKIARIMEGVMDLSREPPPGEGRGVVARMGERDLPPPVLPLP